MKREIKAIIFDFGCVISMDQDSKSVDEMHRILQRPCQVCKESYSKFRPDYDAGLITAEEYWQNICDDCHIACSKSMVDELIRLDVKSWTVINREIRDYIIGLKSCKVKKAIISNMTKEVLEYINKNLTWFEIFDVAVYSCDIKKCKPEKAIYYKCLELLQLQPDECLFVDDSYKNVKSAGEIGIHTIQFKDYKQFRTEIENGYTFR